MKETIDVDIDFPLPRMTFAEAQEKYGSDKPDTRFGMLIEDITAWAEKTDFVVFKNAVETGGTVRAIVAKNAASTYTRRRLTSLPSMQRVSAQKVLHISDGLTKHLPARSTNS